MLLLMISISCVFFILADLVPIYINKEWKLFWVYSVAIALVFVLSILITMGIKLPSPSLLLEKIILAIFNIKKE